MKINQMVSAAILENVLSGVDVRTAIDKVLGEGTFDKIASDVYDQLNARAECRTSLENVQDTLEAAMKVFAK